MSKQMVFLRLTYCARGFCLVKTGLYFIVKIVLKTYSEWSGVISESSFGILPVKLFLSSSLLFFVT